MRGSKPAKALLITPRQLPMLQKYHSKSTISSRDKERIGIVLESSKGIAIKVLARQLGLSIPTIRKWRTRWEESQEHLFLLEQCPKLTDTEFLKEMLTVFSDLPRSGAPISITLAQKEQIVALACEKPEKYGIPITHWNRELLTEIAIKEGIVENISPRYVSVILKNKETSTS